LAEVKGLQLDVEISGNDVPVLFDAEHLGQIIDNLISNALKFTPSGGVVTARASLEEASTCKLLLEISDTGPGISAEDKPRIFDRFFQSTTNDRAATGGTGIGLALVKELVSAMGGSVVVGDRANGGTTFNIQLPMECSSELPSPEAFTTSTAEVSP